MYNGFERMSREKREKTTMTISRGRRSTVDGRQPGELRRRQSTADSRQPVDFRRTTIRQPEDIRQPTRRQTDGRRKTEAGKRKPKVESPAS